MLNFYLVEIITKGAFLLIVGNTPFFFRYCSSIFSYLSFHLSMIMAIFFLGLVFYYLSFSTLIFKFKLIMSLYFYFYLSRSCSLLSGVSKLGMLLLPKCLYVVVYLSLLKSQGFDPTLRKFGVYYVHLALVCFARFINIMQSYLCHLCLINILIINYLKSALQLCSSDQ